MRQDAWTRSQEWWKDNNNNRAEVEATKKAIEVIIISQRIESQITTKEETVTKQKITRIPMEMLARDNIDPNDRSCDIFLYRCKFKSKMKLRIFIILHRVRRIIAFCNLNHLLLEIMKVRFKQVGVNGSNLFINRNLVLHGVIVVLLPIIIVDLELLVIYLFALKVIIVLS